MTDHASGQYRTQVPQVKGRVELRKPKTPYLGSVRFFKHMIIGFIVLMMTAPWAVTAYLAGNGRAAQGEIRQLETKLAMAQEETQTAAETYEGLLYQANADLEEARETIDTMERDGDLYSFDSIYGQIYPTLRVDGPKGYVDSDGVVYLTFDDGPGGSTRAILDVLRRYDIKATFFVVGYSIAGREAILQQIAEEGHNIGVHTNSHVYQDVYGSVESFLYDFYMVADKIEELTGIKPNVFRFPGGSLNSYNEAWGNTIISEMLSRGYRYYDWNVGSGDASLTTDVATIYESVIRQVRANAYSVVLFHDGGGNRSQTVQALPMVIDRLLSDGYRFDMLTNQVRPTVFATASYSRG